VRFPLLLVAVFVRRLWYDRLAKTCRIVHLVTPCGGLVVCMALLRPKLVGHVTITSLACLKRFHTRFVFIDRPLTPASLRRLLLCLMNQQQRFPHDMHCGCDGVPSIAVYEMAAGCSEQHGCYSKLHAYTLLVVGTKCILLCYWHLLV
jgi:hypothetical protein